MFRHGHQPPSKHRATHAKSNASKPNARNQSHSLLSRFMKTTFYLKPCCKLTTLCCTSPYRKIGTDVPPLSLLAQRRASTQMRGGSCTHIVGEFRVNTLRVLLYDSKADRDARNDTRGEGGNVTAGTYRTKPHRRQANAQLQGSSATQASYGQSPMGERITTTGGTRKSLHPLPARRASPTPLACQQHAA